MFPLIVAGAVVGAAGLALGRAIGPRVRGWFHDLTVPAPVSPYPALYPAQSAYRLGTGYTPDYNLSPGSEVIAALPDAWKRWAGARPEVTGAPANTMLALPGLERWTGGDRAVLLDVAAQTGIPVDSILLVLYLESRLDPTQVNSLPAAGLNQLTVDAKLYGFTTPEAVRAIASMSVSEQLQHVVLPFMMRFGQKAVGADPGHLEMLNFLPAVAGAGEDRVIAREGDLTPLVPIAPKTTLNAIYKSNPGFRHGKNYFTVGDVYQNVTAAARKANGRRMAVDGTIIEPSLQSFSEEKVASGGLSGAKHHPRHQHAQQQQQQYTQQDQTASPPPDPSAYSKNTGGDMPDAKNAGAPPNDGDSYDSTTAASGHGGGGGHGGSGGRGGLAVQGEGAYGWPLFNGVYVGDGFTQWVSVTPDGDVYDAGVYPYSVPRRFVAGYVYTAEGDELGSVQWDRDGRVYLADWSADKFAAGCESCMRKAAGGPTGMPAAFDRRDIFVPVRRSQGSWGSAAGSPLSSGEYGGIPNMPSVQTGPRSPFGLGGSFAPWLEGPMWDVDVALGVPNFEELPDFQEPPPEPQPVYLLPPPGLIPIEGVGYVTPQEAERHGARMREDGSWDLSGVRQREVDAPNPSPGPSDKRAAGGCDTPFANARAVYEEPDAPPRKRSSGVNLMGTGARPEDIVRRGILPAVQEGSQDETRWCQITVFEFDLMVTCEPITVGGLRLPTSMSEAYAIGSLIGALPLTKAVSDARWAQGTKVTSLGLGDKSGALLNDPGQVLRYNAKFGPNTGRIRDGYQKEGILVPGLRPQGRGAIAQYGLRKDAAGSVFQEGKPSLAHDEAWKDYTNTPNYMSFAALKNGQPVDLRDELAVGCSLGGPLPAWIIARFRGEVPQVAPLAVV